MFHNSLMNQKMKTEAAVLRALMTMMKLDHMHETSDNKSSDNNIFDGFSLKLKCDG